MNYSTGWMLAAVACGLTWGSLGHAQSPTPKTGGDVVVRIADGTSTRCINPARDQIWLTLRRVIIDKSKGWLTKDTAVALIINASVTTKPSTIKFPLAAQANLRDFATGQVSVPVEYNIVDGLSLTQDKSKISGIELELTVINLKDRAALGVALQTLVDTANKLPIPDNPATQASTYLLKYANDAVSAAMKAHNEQNQNKSATIALNFAPDGQCEGAGRAGFESTGTKIVLQGSGVRGPGYVDVSAVNDYCWMAETSPAFVVKAAKSIANTRCTDAAYKAKFVAITNNYVGFFLNAVGSSGVLGSDIETDKKASLERCKQHGIAAKSCI